jgi:hypothetical protein
MEYSTPARPHDGRLAAAVQHRGWLYKRGHWRQNWTQRYFVIEEGESAQGEYLLNYFKVNITSVSEFNKPPPQGSIPLLGATIFPRAGDGHPFGFSVSARPLRSDSAKTYPLRAASFEERRVWLERLEVLIAASSRAHARAKETSKLSAEGLEAAATEARVKSRQQARASGLAKGEEALKQAKAEEVKLMFALAASRTQHEGSKNKPDPDNLASAHRVVELFGRAAEIFNHFKDDDSDKGQGGVGCGGGGDCGGGGGGGDKGLGGQGGERRREVAMVAMQEFLRKPKIQALLESEAQEQKRKQQQLSVEAGGSARLLPRTSSVPSMGLVSRGGGGGSGRSSSVATMQQPPRAAFGAGAHNAAGEQQQQQQEEEEESTTRSGGGVSGDGSGSSGGGGGGGGGGRFFTRAARALSHSSSSAAAPISPSYNNKETGAAAATHPSALFGEVNHYLGTTAAEELAAAEEEAITTGQLGIESNGNEEEEAEEVAIEAAVEKKTGVDTGVLAGSAEGQGGNGGLVGIVDEWMLPDITSNSEADLETWHGNQDPLALGLLPPPPPPPPPPPLPNPGADASGTGAALGGGGGGGGGGAAAAAAANDDVAAYYRQSLAMRQSLSLSFSRHTTTTTAAARQTTTTLRNTTSLRNNPEEEGDNKEKNEESDEGEEESESAEVEEEEEDDDDEKEAEEKEAAAAALAVQMKAWAEAEEEAEAVAAADDAEGQSWLLVKGFDPLGTGRELKRSKRFPLHSSTPLFEACADGVLPLVKWLWLSKGAGPEDALAVDRYGNTPLHMAVCEAGDLKVAAWVLRKLVEEVVEVEVEVEVGVKEVTEVMTTTTMELVVTKEGVKVEEVKEVEEQAEELDEPTKKQQQIDHDHQHTSSSSPSSRPSPLFDHPHAYLANNFGSTPLLNACQRGHLEVAQWLVQKTGARRDVRRANNSGW